MKWNTSFYPVPVQPQQDFEFVWILFASDNLSLFQLQPPFAFPEPTPALSTNLDLTKFKEFCNTWNLGSARSTNVCCQGSLALTEGRVVVCCITSNQPGELAGWLARAWSEVWDAMTHLLSGELGLQSDNFLFNGRPSRLPGGSRGQQFIFSLNQGRLPFRNSCRQFGWILHINQKIVWHFLSG